MKKQSHSLVSVMVLFIAILLIGGGMLYIAWQRMGNPEVDLGLPEIPITTFSIAAVVWLGVAVLTQLVSLVLARAIKGPAHRFLTSRWLPAGSQRVITTQRGERLEAVQYPSFSATVGYVLVFRWLLPMGIFSVVSASVLALALTLAGVTSLYGIVGGTLLIVVLNILVGPVYLVLDWRRIRQRAVLTTKKMYNMPKLETRVIYFLLRTGSLPSFKETPVSEMAEPEVYTDPEHANPAHQTGWFRDLVSSLLLTWTKESLGTLVIKSRFGSDDILEWMSYPMRLYGLISHLRRRFQSDSAFEATVDNTLTSITTREVHHGTPVGAANRKAANTRATMMTSHKTNYPPQEINLHLVEDPEIYPWENKFVVPREEQTEELLYQQGGSVWSADD